MSRFPKLSAGGRAYQEGKLAFRLGKKLVDNPYINVSEWQEINWRRGFQDTADKPPKRGRPRAKKYVD